MEVEGVWEGTPVEAVVKENYGRWESAWVVDVRDGGGGI
jgi:hypothetical protein